MRISYKYAVLSFCADLTDPTASSEPLAVVGVGTADREPKFWFYVSPSQPGDAVNVGDDQVSKNLLNDLPQLVARQFADAREQIGAGDFVTWLDDRFRNSLHVSSITERTEDVGLDSFVAELVRLYQAEVDPQKSQRPRVPVMRMEPILEARA